MRRNKYNNKKLFWRAEEVRPVAAWVLPETSEAHSNPMISAMAEEKRLQDIQICKEIKLKHFQETVKQRLALTVKSNREKQLQKFLKTAQDKHLIISKGYHNNSEIVEDDEIEEYRYENYFDDNPHQSNHITEVNNNNSSSLKDLTRRAYMDSERERVKEIKRQQQIKRRLNRQREMQDVEKIFKMNNLRISKPSAEVEPKSELVIKKNDLIEVSCTNHKHHIPDINIVSNGDRMTSLRLKKPREDIEQDRLISDLKENLAMKLSNSGQSFPQLCFCCSNFLQIDPRTCAKNCSFSSNPSSLIRALKTLSCS